MLSPLMLRTAFCLLGFGVTTFVTAEEKNSVDMSNTTVNTSNTKVNTTVNTSKPRDQSNSSIETSNWKCKYCPEHEDEQWKTSVDLGMGYVTNNSYKYGEYNGLNDEAAFLIFDIDAMYRDEKANYLDIKSDNIGLETRRLDLEAGKQGKYRVNVLIDNIVKHNLDTSRTLYTGTANATLPTGWVRAITTNGMTGLTNELRNVYFSTERAVVAVNSKYILNEKWSYGLKFNRQRQEGNSPFSAMIGTTFADATSATISKPIDFTTDTFELSADYNYKKVTSSISFVRSLFTNKNDSISWENAFSTGANSGQAALEPDNEMQQIIASGQYRRIEDIILTGLFSIASLKQNQVYLPYTVNGALTTTALPRQSLDGNVDLYNANFGVNWIVNNKSRIKFIYEHQEHSNTTNRGTYSYVIGDNAFSGTPRANFPYSFRNRKIKIKASSKLSRKNKVSAGLDYGYQNRTYQEVDSARLSSLWAKYASKLTPETNLKVKLKRDSRRADGYNVLAELNPAENPQLRKYNLADKDESKAAINFSFMAAENVNLDINVEFSATEYSNSAVGLRSGDEWSAGVDAQYAMSDELSFTGYLQQSLISSNQYGSSAGSNSDWIAENNDSTQTVGLGGNVIVIENKFNLGFSFTHSEATGEIVFSGASATALPDLTSTRDTASIYADYNYSENMVVKLRFDYENYKAENWNLDGVTQGSIDNVLNLGDQSPNYTIGAVWLSMKYVLR